VARFLRRANGRPVALDPLTVARTRDPLRLRGRPALPHPGNGTLLVTHPDQRKTPKDPLLWVGGGGVEGRRQLKHTGRKKSDETIT